MPVANYDLLTFMPPAFRKVSRDGYFELVAHFPRLLGGPYDATDKPSLASPTVVTDFEVHGMWLAGPIWKHSTSRLPGSP